MQRVFAMGICNGHLLREDDGPELWFHRFARKPLAPVPGLTPGPGSRTDPGSRVPD